MFGRDAGKDRHRCDIPTNQAEARVVSLPVLPTRLHFTDPCTRALRTNVREYHIPNKMLEHRFLANSLGTLSLSGCLTDATTPGRRVKK